MSKSVKLKDGSYIDSEGISTKVYTTSGTYVTATWAESSSVPKLTLGKKGLYLVHIAWDAKTNFPSYVQLNLRGVNINRLSGFGSLYDENMSAKVKLLSANYIIEATADNAQIYGYMHTGVADLSFVEGIVAVYLGAVE